MQQIREHYEQFYANKLDNVNGQISEKTQTTKRYKLFPSKKIGTLDSPTFIKGIDL